MEAKMTFDFKEMEKWHLKKLQDLSNTKKSKLLSDIGMLIVSDVASNFENQRDPDGVKWDELKQKTIDGRPKGKKIQYDHKILQKSGKLMQSVGTYKKGDNYVVVGSKLPYSRIHQWGGTINIPEGTRSSYYSHNKQNETLKRTKKGRANFETTHNVSGHKITIPQRAYMGFSKPLLIKTQRLCLDYIK